MSELSAKSLCKQAGIGWHEAVDSQALAVDLAQYVATVLQEEIDRNASASLIVSGGSTPAPVFRCLAKSDIQWERVSVSLADERWVPPGHPDSNESLVRDTLLVDNARVAGFVSLYRNHSEPADAIAAVTRDVDAMAHPFTVTLLGMGGDGHTASLFPDAPADQLREAMQLKSDGQLPARVAVLNPPSVDQIRISLTRSALLNSAYRVLHITGHNKSDVLARAMSESTIEGEAIPAYTPGFKPVIGLLAPQSEKATVYWSP